MQNILPVLCFAAGLVLAWVLLRRRAQDAETAFKALSADALARNNQAFLDLARSALAQTQEAARGDLEKRQQAIGELVAPVRASLDGMAGKIQELDPAGDGREVSNYMVRRQRPCRLYAACFGNRVRVSARRSCWLRSGEAKEDEESL